MIISEFKKSKASTAVASPEPAPGNPKIDSWKDGKYRMHTEMTFEKRHVSGANIDYTYEYEYDKHTVDKPFIKSLMHTMLSLGVTEPNAYNILITFLHEEDKTTTFAMFGYKPIGNPTASVVWFNVTNVGFSHNQFVEVFKAFAAKTDLYAQKFVVVNGIKCNQITHKDMAG